MTEIEDDYLKYLKEKKDISMKKYIEIENSLTPHDNKTKEYKNYQNKVNTLSNKLSNINNSLYFYEQFLIKKNAIKKDNNDKFDQMINKFAKLIMIINFFDFKNNKSKLDTKDVHLYEMFENLKQFPINENEIKRNLKYNIYCLKLLFDSDDDYLDEKFQILKNNYKNTYNKKHNK